MGPWMPNVLIILFFVMWRADPSLTENVLSVRGPDHPIEATLGSDIVLPCYLSPSSDAENMDIQWSKQGLSRLVHHFINGKNQMAKQDSRYLGRTTLFFDSLKNGNVSLLLQNIEPGDEGRYICSVIHGIEATTNLELVLNAVGLQPWISMTRFQNNSLLLTCNSAGWYPQPVMSWTHTKRHHVIYSIMVSEEANGLLTLQSSLRIDSLEPEILECKIQLKHNDQTKRSAFQITESMLEDFTSSQKTVSILVAFLVILIITLIIVIGVTSYLFRKKKEENRNLKRSLELAEIQRSAVNITLDPDTAHCNLHVNENLLSVYHSDEPKRVDSMQGRFDSWVAVLASQEFSSGKAYWEVFVGSKSNWDIGVTYTNSNRIGWINMGPNYGYWGLRLLDNKIVIAMMDPPIALNTTIPKKIGVFLDYDGKHLSFYNVEDKTCIYKCEAQFTNALQPYFSPGHNKNQTNAYPLQIVNYQNYSDVPHLNIIVNS